MPQFLAVDADSRALAAVAGSVGRDGLALTGAAALLEGVGPLAPETAADLGAKLGRLLKSSGIKPAPLLMAVGRDRCIIKEIKHPPVPGVDEPAVVRFQALKELTEHAGDGVLDYVPLPGTLTTGEKRAAVVFVRNDTLVAAKALAQAAGLKLAGVTPRPFAAASVLARLNADPAQAQGILAVWPGGGELTVVRNGVVLYSRAIPGAATADETKLAGELRRNLAVYATQQPDAPLARLLLPEPPVAGVSWSGRLDGMLPVPVESFDPLAGLSADVPDAARSRFAAPVGLLVAAAAGGVSINFAQPRQPKAEANPHRTRILAGALVGIAACATLAIVGYLELDKAGRRLRAAINDGTDVDAQIQQVELQGKRLAAADEFTGREVVILDELYDLAERFPDNQKTRLQEFTATALKPPPVKSVAAPVATPSVPGAPPAATPVVVTPKAPAKPQPVAQLVLTLATDDAAAVDRFVDGLARDPYYAGTKKLTGGLASAGSKLQQFTVSTQVLHRPADQYRRKLVPPPKPVAPAAPAAAPGAGRGPGGGFDFEGGF